MRYKIFFLYKNELSYHYTSEKADASCIADLNAEQLPSVQPFVWVYDKELNLYYAYVDPQIREAATSYHIAGSAIHWFWLDDISCILCIPETSTLFNYDVLCQSRRSLKETEETRINYNNLWTSVRIKLKPFSDKFFIK